MKVSDIFVTRYLRAADLGGRAPLVTVKAVSRQDFPDGPRLVVAFEEGSKLLSLNRTNARELARLFGDETAGWIGQRVRLVVRDVDYRGQMVPAVRVAPADAAAAPPKAADPFGGLGDGPDF